MDRRPLSWAAASSVEVGAAEFSSADLVVGAPALESLESLASFLSAASSAVTDFRWNHHAERSTNHPQRFPRGLGVQEPRGRCGTSRTSQRREWQGWLRSKVNFRMRAAPLALAASLRWLPSATRGPLRSTRPWDWRGKTCVASSGCLPDAGAGDPHWSLWESPRALPEPH